MSSCQLKVEASALEDSRWNSFHAVKCSQVNVFEFLPQDKRRIQEDIAKKRRQIEEEKLKLQYIKVILNNSEGVNIQENMSCTRCVNMWF